MRINCFLKMALLCVTSSLYADTAKFTALVIDDNTGMPLPGVTVRANFTEDIGWRAWTESSIPDVDIKETDSNGSCRLTGKTNCGDVCCWVPEPPKGYYAGRGWGHGYTKKDLFGVWQPDNLVATIRLQRVEHPIPLFVKRAELRNYEHGIGGFDGTNSVLSIDLVKGDWLPPYGKGEVADMQINSTLFIKGRERFRFEPGKYDWLYFYELRNSCSFLELDAVSELVTCPNDGIKIRDASIDPASSGIIRSLGNRRAIERNGKDWYCEWFKDWDPNRCYTFRIRTRRNEKGEIVEAYYGKIYGDFEFEGDDKKGLIGVKFLYYLNPKSLDRNLEWDMKNNLCPNPGGLSMPQP